jgi:DNA-binding transcriptional LysR family regulator
MAAPFDLELYRTFIWVVDSGGFTAAASRLYRTQATVSQQIKRLEHLMGRALLTRTSRQIDLTPAGAALLPFARHILQMQAQAAATVQGTQREPLRLGVPDLYADSVLPALLEVIAMKANDLTPVVECDQSANLFAHFTQGELDVILSARYPNFPPGQVVSNEPLIWVGPPNFDLPPNNQLPLILYPDGCPFRARALAALEYAQRPWQIVYTGQSGAALLTPLRLGMGITVMSRHTLPNALTELNGPLNLPAIKPCELDLHVSGPLLNRLGASFEEQLQQAASQAL